ncbi:H(+)-ATPase [Conidiobolus coronatus NRRL 28638]|uniref:Plasma membrane ATPase n=1 Tax=Conidiobolus coronatus (strain ATCC 28846 / CBS 209.66 / NRRL 28638) TaxID=796925 RepID=A0A137PAQ6_CONC2|nr:H(+)-ATPase [Conidiobolus coronatus NRRL 28638]|eukprot:KXN72066.1 H(+)-ATPase [Conidiobolus coronatus NRRL 28638]
MTTVNNTNTSNSNSIEYASKSDDGQGEFKENFIQITAEHELLLNTDVKHGLTQAEVEQRRQTFGLNCLEKPKQNRFLKFIKFFIDPISFLIELAAILSIVTKDWPNVGILCGLLVLNAVIGFYQEYKAEISIAALEKSLATRTKVWRDGKYDEVDSEQLVPGDIVVLRIGDITPADIKLLGLNNFAQPTSDPLSLDQAALTGESFPVNKYKDEFAYSSSVVKQGQMMGVVVHIGMDTFIGKTAHLINQSPNSQGHFQKIIQQIGNLLVLIAVTLVLIIFIVNIVRRGVGRIMDIIENVIVLAVVSIPAGLPTILSATLAVGANQLAAKKVIVKRLTSIEEFAAMSILCSDKTGTITLSELTLDEPYMANEYTEEQLMKYAFLASEAGTKDPIETAVRDAAREKIPSLTSPDQQQLPEYEIMSFTPFNPTAKRTEAVARLKANDKPFRVCKGAPPVILKMANATAEDFAQVDEFASRGLRALAIAKTRIGDNDWELVGMISFVDPPRPDSKDTIAKCRQLGVDVKMITGDQGIIAKEVARRLDMQRVILNPESLMDEALTEEELIERCLKCNGFAHVIPEHKYRVVELLQTPGNIVGMTGDGVNDAPALRKANVGIAVHGSTDAARSAADIVLLDHGLSTIVNGITVSRQVFHRMRAYALFSISTALHVVFFFFIIMLAFDWSMSPLLLILIIMLINLATLVVSIDQVPVAPKPTRWRISQLLGLSVIFAILLTIWSLIHWLVFRFGFGISDGRLQTLTFFQLASSPQLLIFSTRVNGFMWTNIPSLVFTAAVLSTQVIAALICCLGIPGFVGNIGFEYVIVIFLMSVIYTVILDLAKVLVYNFDFSMKIGKYHPLRRIRNKLVIRKAKEIESKRKLNTIKKLKLAQTLVESINNFKV